MSRGKNSILGIALGVFLAKAIERLFKVLRRLLFRWRRALTPLWFACMVWFVAVLWRWMWPGWWPLVLLLPAGGLTLAIIGPRLSERWHRIVLALVPEGLDRGTSGMLDRPVERIYFAALTAWIGAWMALRIADGPSDITLWSWRIGLVLFGGIWWYHRRVRIAGKADRYARKWAKLRDGRTNVMELKCFIKSKPVRAIGSRGSARLRIKLAEGITYLHASKAAGALASFYGLRPGSAFVTEDETSAKHIWVLFLPKDPWKTKISHPMPVPSSTTLAGLNFRFEMGLHADARRATYRLQHTLIIGQSGSGKSVWLESLITWLLACKDVAIIGIDLASGATLGIWRKIFAIPLATTTPQALDVLTGVLGVIEDRERQLGISKEEDESDIDSFQPSPETPWLVLFIDEFPDLVMGEDGKPHKVAVALLSRITKRARKAGVWLVLSAQNGSKADLGAKEIQAQFTATVGLQLDQHASRVLWGDLTRQQGWSSTALRTGQYLLRDPEHMTPDIAKGFFVPPRERRALVSQAQGDRPRLESSAWAALTGAASIELDPHEEPTPADPILAAIHKQPRKADEIAALPGMPSRATVYRRLAAFKENGHAHSINGIWYPGTTVDGEVVPSVS
jgi:hypothetical protein